MTSETRTMLKAGSLAVAALLFLIGAFVDDPQVVWGLGFMLLALGLLVDVAAGLMGSMSRGSGPGST